MVLVKDSNRLFKKYHIFINLKKVQIIKFIRNIGRAVVLNSITFNNLIQ